MASEPWVHVGGGEGHGHAFRPPVWQRGQGRLRWSKSSWLWLNMRVGPGLIGRRQSNSGSCGAPAGRVPEEFQEGLGLCDWQGHQEGGVELSEG